MPAAISTSSVIHSCSTFFRKMSFTIISISSRMSSAGIKIAAPKKLQPFVCSSESRLVTIITIQKMMAITQGEMKTSQRLGVVGLFCIKMVLFICRMEFLQPKFILSSAPGFRCTYLLCFGNRGGTALLF